MRRTACERCRIKKLKCSKSKPCEQCLQSGHDCAFRDLRTRPVHQTLIAPAIVDEPVMLEESNIVDLSKQILERDSDQRLVQSIDAIPGSKASQLIEPTTFRWRNELSYILPSVSTLTALSDNYFHSVNWFMMVVDEIPFKQKATAALADDYMKTSDRNFCTLMSLIWGLGAHYLLINPTSFGSLPISRSLVSDMIQVADSAYLRVMSSPSLEAVQIAILLGSYHLFNGLPYLGFAIFGSGVRCAQAIGLHRQSHTSRSEACKVWWALEIADKYAAVAFGLPCAIDDSDSDVPELDDVTASALPQSSSTRTITSLTYHKYKSRLYRIMGPFLGRKKQTNQLRPLLDVRRELANWYAGLPDLLKCPGDSPEFNDWPIYVQMQAIALQLAYDNLQMVLFRQAVFPKYLREDHRPYMSESIRQLSESATRTANISTFAGTETICQSSHAAMHVGICSFTAGVILCRLITYQPDNQDKTNWLGSLKKIIVLFERFSDEHYRLATQSLRLLKILENYVNPQAGDISVESTLFGSQAQAEMLNSVTEAFNDDVVFANPGVNTPVAPNFNGLGSSTSGPLDDIGQLWLWTDEPNEYWTSNLA